MTSMFNGVNKVLVLLTLMLSLFYSRLFNWETEPNNSFAYLLMSVVVMESVIFQRNKRLSFGQYEAIVLLFAFYILVCGCIRPGIFLHSLNFIAILLFCVWIYKNLRSIDVSIGIALLGLFELGYVCYHWHVGQANFPGTFDNTALTSTLFAVSAPVNLGIAAKFKKYKMLVLMAYLVTLFQLIIIVLNQTRAAEFAVICVLLVFFLGKIKYKRKHVLAALLFVFFILLTLSYTFKNDSALGRLLVWKIVFLNSTSISLIGVGLSNFQHNYLLWQSEYFAALNFYTNESVLADAVSTPFNEFLSYYCEIGLIGVVLFFLIPAKNCFYKCYDPIHLSLKLSLITISIISFFTYTFHCIPFIIFFVSLSMFLTEHQKQNRRKSQKYSIIIHPFFIATAFTLLFTFFCNRYEVQRKFALLQNFTIPYDSVSNHIRGYERLYPFLRHNGYFLYDFASINLRLPL